MQVVKVNDVGPEATQAVLAGGLEDFGTAIELPLIPAAQAALGREDELPAPITENLANQGFIVPKTIDGGRVEEGVASVQGAFQHPLGLLPGWGGAIGV